MAEQDMPADWVLLEAARRFGWDHEPENARHWRAYYPDPYTPNGNGYRALCDMIAKYEQAPVDPLLIEARKIAADARQPGFWTCADPLRDGVACKIAAGKWDNHMAMIAALAALRRGMELAKEQGK